MFDPAELALILHQDGIDLLAAAVAFAGLSTCIFGLRIWRGVLAVLGLVVGGAVGSLAAMQQAPDKTLAIVGLGIASACTLMVLASWLNHFTTMVIVAAIGWYLGLRLGAQFGVPQTDLFVCAIGGALVFGILAILFEMPAVILLSALGGAWAVVWGASLYWGNGFYRVIDAMTLYTDSDRYSMELSVVGVLAAVGLTLQVIGWVRAGPDMREIKEAVDMADMPRKRRVSMLEDLRADGAISRSEYFRHMIRILSGA